MRSMAIEIINNPPYCIAFRDTERKAEFEVYAEKEALSLYMEHREQDVYIDLDEQAVTELQMACENWLEYRKRSKVYPKDD